MLAVWALIGITLLTSITILVARKMHEVYEHGKLGGPACVLATVFIVIGIVYVLFCVVYYISYGSVPWFSTQVGHRGLRARYFTPLSLAVVAVSAVVLANLIWPPKPKSSFQQAAANSSALATDMTEEKLKWTKGTLIGVAVCMVIALGFFVLSQANLHVNGKHPQTVAAMVEKVEPPDPAEASDRGTVTVRLDCGNTVDVRLAWDNSLKWNELKKGDAVKVTSRIDHITDNTTFLGNVRRATQLDGTPDDLGAIQGNS